MLFTASLEGWAWNLSRWSEQATGQAKTNKKSAHETEQQEPQFNPGHEGHIREVLQEDDCSSMYRTIVA
jgi:hypothetical protein